MTGFAFGQNMRRQTRTDGSDCQKPYLPFTWAAVEGLGHEEKAVWGTCPPSSNAIVWSSQYLITERWLRGRLAATTTVEEPETLLCCI